MELSDSSNVDDNSDEDEEHTVVAASTSVSEVEMDESNCKGRKL